MSTPKTHKRIFRKARRGFTLIELMTATMLMMLIVGFILKMTGDILNTWNGAFSKMTTNLTARQALDLIALDVEAAMIKENTSSSPTRWLEIHRTKNSDIGSDLARFDHMFFYAPTSIRQKTYYSSNERVPIPGDICAMSYRVAFLNPLDPSSNEDKRFVLYRAVVDPVATFYDYMGISNGENLQADLQDNWQASGHSQPLIDEDGKRGYSGSAWDFTTETMNLLAVNVVALEIEPLYKDVDEDGEVTYDSDLSADSHIIPPDQDPNPRVSRNLEAIDISLITISEEGESVIRNLELAGQLTQEQFESLVYKYDDSSGEYILGIHAERYKKRIRIKSSSF